MLRPFRVLSSKPLMQRHVFRLREDVVENPRNGATLGITVVECRDWCNVIAVTPAAQLVLVRQWRHGTRGFTLEPPGGLIDAGESPLEAAARELREETGYTSERIVPLGSIAPNPAIMDNRVHNFLALDAVAAGAVHPDDGEDLEVVLRPLAGVAGMITRGEIDHAVVVAAFVQLAALAGGRLGAVPDVPRR